MQEKWKDYYTKDELKELQQIELQNLNTFISVCEKLGLEYFLYGGTLLGLVKYGGFVPWDDDIDVALPRDSYNKFIMEAPTLLPEGFFLQNPYNCKRCPYPYTKLRKRGTEYVEFIHRNLPIETGVYIDIYPIDHIPDDENKRRRQFRLVQRWINIYILRQTRTYDASEEGIKRNIKKIIKTIASVLFHVLPAQYCMNKIDRYMSMYNHDKNAKRYGALNSPVYDNIYNDIYPLLEGKFESIKVRMPFDYLEHLKRRYGDIESVPPIEERFGHIPYILKL